MFFISGFSVALCALLYNRFSLSLHISEEHYFVTLSPFILSSLSSSVTLSALILSPFCLTLLPCLLLFCLPSVLLCYPVFFYSVSSVLLCYPVFCYPVYTYSVFCYPVYTSSVFRAQVIKTRNPTTVGLASVCGGVYRALLLCV